MDFAYAVANFALFMFYAPSGQHAGQCSGDVAHGFSGHWMAFYSSELAIGMTTAYRRGL